MKERNEQERRGKRLRPMGLFGGTRARGEHCNLIFIIRIRIRIKISDSKHIYFRPKNVASDYPLRHDGRGREEGDMQYNDVNDLDAFKSK